MSYLILETPRIAFLFLALSHCGSNHTLISPALWINPAHWMFKGDFRSPLLLWSCTRPRVSTLNRLYSVKSKEFRIYFMPRHKTVIVYLKRLIFIIIIMRPWQIQTRSLFVEYWSPKSWNHQYEFYCAHNIFTMPLRLRDIACIKRMILKCDHH